jgi:vesicle coat complex subunit
MEIKKLVYVYLMRYAEEQQDLALLSIATFQRGLKVNFPPPPKKNHLYFFY